MRHHSRIEDLCQDYLHYRKLGLSVHCADTLLYIKDEIEHTDHETLEHLRKKYVHVFSHIKPSELHGCYEGNQ